MPHNDRRLILDLSAIEAHRGPQPNDFFVCVTPREAAGLATTVAVALRWVNCHAPDCENCNQWHRLFWDLVGELGPRLQGEVFQYLEKSGVGTPTGPWEEVGA